MKLDPANRSCCLNSFEENDAVIRTALIEKMLVENGGFEKVSIEHIFKGKVGERSISPRTLVEFKTRHDREGFLTKMQSAQVKDAKGASISCVRAKTQIQLARNSSLHQAKRLISEHASGKGQNVKIEWRLEGSRTRTVVVGDVIAFSQEMGDMTGTFAGVFLDLHL